MVIPRMAHSKTWNADAKPFTWIETAEEILDSLKRFCERISGTRHKRDTGAHSSRYPT